MKLDELYTLNHLPLKAPDNVPSDGLDDFTERLQRHGFISLGMGAYGTVFTNVRLGYAVKVFETNDWGYRSFLAFVHANPNNPHLPKFRGKFVKINDHFSACRMEILDRLNGNEKEALQQARRCINACSSAEELMDGATNQWTDTALFSPAFFETMFDLYLNSQSSHLYWDLHGGNVMKRGQTLVIIDPYTNL